MAVTVSMEIPYIKPDGSLTYEGMNLWQDAIAEIAAAGASPSISLDGLSDVVITSASTGQALRFDGTNWVNGSAIALQTAVSASSQTSIDFTSIPSWVNRITVMFNGLSTNGTSLVIVQLGDSGGVETTNYLGASSTLAAAVGSVALSSGFTLNHGAGAAAAATQQGAMILSRITGNTWSCIANMALSDAARMCVTAGTKTLSATLDRVRITTAGGVDTFDAGSVAISLE